MNADNVIAICPKHETPLNLSSLPVLEGVGQAAVAKSSKLRELDRLKARYVINRHG